MKPASLLREHEDRVSLVGSLKGPMGQKVFIAKLSYHLLSCLPPTQPHHTELGLLVLMRTEARRVWLRRFLVEIRPWRSMQDQLLLEAKVTIEEGIKEESSSEGL